MLPNINIVFKEQGITAITRGQRGIVALILRDTFGLEEPAQIYTAADTPVELNEFNKEQINLALLGYQRPPRKVVVYVIDDLAVDYAEALNYLETVRFDYLAIPEIEAGETEVIATWIKGLRDTKDKRVKAVLPNMAADHEGVINFASQIIKTIDKTFTTAEYCGRIAGLLAGTPMQIAATYATLPEVIDTDHLTREEFNVGIGEGELLLYNDGDKVKIARGVNSLITTTDLKGDSFKKIKILDAMDMIHDDIKKTAEDNYLGKYANSYDNKCLLISAIGGYFDTLELDGILDKDKSFIGIDIESQAAYLKSVGYAEPDGRTIVDMNEQEIKQANTKDKVFLAASVKILDAIEDIVLNISI